MLENSNKVILVDDNDREIGLMDKMQAHREGRLHRAFSVFIFNSEGQLLMQKRARDKYHSAGLWTNTCCSHPMPGEDVNQAAKRRLSEEMNLYTDLSYLFTFRYRSEFENKLIEHEIDHVLIGKTDDFPIMNRNEVQEWSYFDVNFLKTDLSNNPDKYTSWFAICFDELLEKLGMKNGKFEGIPEN